MIELKGKRVLVIGERDGVNGPAIEACVRSAGAEVLYAETLTAAMEDSSSPGAAFAVGR